MKTPSFVPSSITLKLPSVLKSDLPGITWLCDFASASIGCFDQNVVIDFSGCSYIEGNLYAVIGSVVHGLQSRKCTVFFSDYVPSPLKNTMANNGFGQAFQPHIEWAQKTNNDAVTFSWFRKEEEQAFRDYIEKEIFIKLLKLQLSEALRKKMKESIAEIYVNAHTHGRCDLVFCCGQFFPQSGMFNITFVDLGRTIKANVQEFEKKIHSGISSIEWALTEPNSTKTGQSGGFGLKLTRDFIRMNHGKMHIISADGFWALEQSIYHRQLIPIVFPGTIVTLTFDLKDKREYRLMEEAVPLSNPF